MNYTIRSYDSSDRRQVAELFRRLWSRSIEENEAYLTWRYEQNPYLENSMAVAEFDQRVVAVRGAYGMKWKVGDASELMPCMGDTVTKREHEGRQLVQKLTRFLMAELKAKGVRYVVNQSPGPVVAKISARSGWQRVGHRYATECLDPEQKRDSFDNLDEHARDFDDLQVLVKSSPPAEICELPQRGGLVCHHLDREYFEWRFRNPLCEYRWVCAYSQGLCGYVALCKHLIQNKQRTYILDMWGESSGIQASLLEHTLDWGSFSTVRLWWRLFPRAVSSLLASRDFVPVPAHETRKKFLIINSVEPDAGFQHHGVDLLNIKNWDARLYHSDGT